MIALYKMSVAEFLKFMFHGNCEAKMYCLELEKKHVYFAIGEKSLFFSICEKPISEKELKFPVKLKVVESFSIITVDDVYYVDESGKILTQILKELATKEPEWKADTTQILSIEESLAKEK
jgi:hypothetical protein